MGHANSPHKQESPSSSTASLGARWLANGCLSSSVLSVTPVVPEQYHVGTTSYVTKRATSSQFTWFSNIRGTSPPGSKGPITRTRHSRSPSNASQRVRVWKASSSSLSSGPQWEHPVVLARPISRRNRLIQPFLVMILVRWKDISPWGWSAYQLSRPDGTNESTRGRCPWVVRLPEPPRPVHTIVRTLGVRDAIYSDAVINFCS